MENKKVLVTCPPMIGMFDHFEAIARNKYKLEIFKKEVVQTLSEKELISIVGSYDGWIIGDDPASRKVFEAGKNGNLKAAIKWGIGVDNVDIKSAKDLDISIENTPGMFGKEVSDLAMGYLICMTRKIITIHDGVKNGLWLKPSGVSLDNKKAAVIGFGDIGRNLTKRLLASDVLVNIYDPFVNENDIFKNSTLLNWPVDIENCDFIFLTCSLNKGTFHILNDKIFDLMKKGVIIINVSRGPLIDEKALIDNLSQGKIAEAALDVFEKEPLPINSKLRNFDNCIFGSHNASNTSEAVIKTSLKALELLDNFLNKK